MDAAAVRPIARPEKTHRGTVTLRCFSSFPSVFLYLDLSLALALPIVFAARCFFSRDRDDPRPGTTRAQLLECIQSHPFLLRLSTGVALKEQ